MSRHLYPFIIFIAVAFGIFFISHYFLAKQTPRLTQAQQITTKTSTFNTQKRYQKPEKLTKTPRPAITIDESRHPRWVTRLEDSSLRGTEVDRPRLKIAEDGSVELSPSIVFYFDYFFSLNGEMSPERIQQLLYDDIYAHFPEQAANQLYDLVLRYTQYSQAIDEYLASLTPEDVKAQGITNTVVSQNFQTQYFSNEEIDALFNDYDKMLTFTPKTRSTTTKMQQYNATPETERYAKAIELFGEDTANRLQQLEQQDQQWQLRLENYKREKQQIIDAHFDNNTEQAQIQALKDRSFSQSEQVRVRTWEKFMQ